MRRIFPSVLLCAALTMLAAAGCGDSGGANQVNAPPTDKEGNRGKLNKLIETKPEPSKGRRKVR